MRYETPERLRRTLTGRGFSIMVHDLYHDGKLFQNRTIFEPRRDSINDFLKTWETRGFVSGSALHDLSWISELDIDYSISTFDVDPFEPQDCGMGRIFPFWVQSPHGVGRGYVELPYTLPQDFTLFSLMREKSNAIWRQKLDWIADNGGMALIKTHPDYINFDGRDRNGNLYPVAFYTDFLDYVRSRYGDEVWVASPAEVASYWSGLRVPQLGYMNEIEPEEMFCNVCRNASADGWLHQYPPDSSRQPGREMIRTPNVASP